jgi:hypothetical protein
MSAVPFYVAILGVTLILAPVPDTTTLPPEKAWLPTNVPTVEAEKIPPSV